MKFYKYFLLSLGVILIDQTTKLLVHNNMELGIPGEILVFGDWFRLHYLLNPGMAFGLQLQTEYGGLGGAGTQRVVAEINRRIATLSAAQARQR